MTLALAALRLICIITADAGWQEDPFDYEPYRQILLATWHKSVGSDVDADCILCRTSHQIALADVKVQYIPTFCISLFCAVTCLTCCQSRHLCPLLTPSVQHNGCLIPLLMLTDEASIAYIQCLLHGTLATVRLA